jgi:hypothetical protein
MFVGCPLTADVFTRLPFCLLLLPVSLLLRLPVSMGLFPVEVLRLLAMPASPLGGLVLL